MTDAARKLTEFCQNRAGDHLRGVFTYGPDDGEVVFAREDLQDQYVGEEFEEVREAAWTIHRTVLDEEPRIRGIGRYQTTIHTFDDAFVFQFRESPHRGTLVALDQDVGRNLHEFLTACERVLQ